MSEEETGGFPSENPEKDCDTDSSGAIWSADDAKKIEDHIQKFIGEIDTTFHEIVSDLMHLDVYIVNPTPERNFYTLITTGMSSLPMSAPEYYEDCQFAELIICLPPDWPLGDDEWDKPNNYWPIAELRFLARYPHTDNTWLWWGHTIAHGRPPEPFAASTKMSGSILWSPKLAPKDFFTLETNEDKTIHFFSFIPLYVEEMNFKIKKGTDKLVQRFEKFNVNELLNVERPNVCIRSI